MNIFLALAIMLGGLALHFGKKMLEFEDAGESMSPMAYARARPWRIFVTIGSCVAAIFTLQWMDQLNAAAALFTGFSGSSAFDTLRSMENRNTTALLEDSKKTDDDKAQVEIR